jgi:two-component sensor histidine kinase
LKHAFPGGRAGTVRVELKRIDAKRYALAVRDDGVGLPAGLAARSAESLGLQLVHDLTQQLHGTIVAGGDGGTTFSVTFDADARPESPR